MKWLKPNVLGLILFLPCAVLGQYMLVLWPFPLVLVWIVVATGAAAPAILTGLEWIVLPCAMAMPLGRLLAIATRPRRRDIALTVCITAAAALLAAIFVSKLYWGYYFSRPPLDPRVVRGRHVRYVTPVVTPKGPGGAPEARFVTNANFSLEKAIQYGRTDPYDSPEYRSLVVLAERQLLPGSSVVMPEAALTSAYALLESSRVLVPGDTGYADARHLSGILLEFEDDSGEVLALLGVVSGEISNDHHAYYELVFSGPLESDRSRLLSTTRFFFDVAGIEGVEWWVMWLVFAALGNVITVPAVVIARARKAASP